MLVLRLAFTAVAISLIVWSLRSGYPLAGLVFIPLIAVWIRRTAESGEMASRLKRDAA